MASPKIAGLLRRKLNEGENYCDRESELSRRKRSVLFASTKLVLAPNYANDAKTFLKHFSDCLFCFCSTCADAWSRNKINGC